MTVLPHQERIDLPLIAGAIYTQFSESQVLECFASSKIVVFFLVVARKRH